MAEDKSKKQNAKEWPSMYSCRFLKDGLVSYEDSGCGINLIKKETIDRMMNSFLGKPVIIKHMEVTPGNFEDKAVGYITDVFFNSTDGWHWCKFLLINDKAKEVVANGYSVSCAYKVTDFGPGGENHAIRYENEILQGEGEHLALVPNPRYEECGVPQLVLNSKAARYENEEKELGGYRIGDRVELIDSEDGKGRVSEFVGGGRMRVRLIDGGFVDVRPEQVKAINRQNTRITTQGLSEVDLNTLDPYEEREYKRMTKQGMSKEEALQVIINTVGGDWFQLSRQLRKLAEKDQTFKNASISREVSIPRNLLTSENEAELRAAGFVNIGVGGGTAEFEINGMSESAAMAKIKSILGTVRGVDIYSVENSKLDRESPEAKAQFEKEKKEHPEFTDEDIWKIVRDHITEKQNTKGAGAMATMKEKIVKILNDFGKAVNEAFEGKETTEEEAAEAKAKAEKEAQDKKNAEEAEAKKAKEEEERKNALKVRANKCGLAENATEEEIVKKENEMKEEEVKKENERKAKEEAGKKHFNALNSLRETGELSPDLSAAVPETSVERIKRGNDRYGSAKK